MKAVRDLAPIFATPCAPTSDQTFAPTPNAQAAANPALQAVEANRLSAITTAVQTMSGTCANQMTRQPKSLLIIVDCTNRLSRNADAKLTTSSFWMPAADRSAGGFLKNTHP